MNYSNPARPNFPARVVITGGMPYGEKMMHFAHVGAIFVQADIFARFMRDRIGAKNVMFMSGTDCYGAGVVLGHEKAVESGFDGNITDFVAQNHAAHKATLESYEISLNLFGASALDTAGEIHASLSAEVFEKLRSSGNLKLMSAMQFYDEERGVFLNGRQVRGRCPIQGCKSEVAYAEECALGHQYNPSELIAPVSVLSGQTPVQRAVQNWYFDMPAYSELMTKQIAEWENDLLARGLLTRVVKEFVRPPSIHVKKELLDEISAISGIPAHTVITEEGKVSAELIFTDLAAREAAVELLSQYGIRYRTGKTLVPLRISGNLDWGVPVPSADGVNGLTFWVWPESLWAPISFTKTALSDGGDWHEWWKSSDSRVYQFIGEDNIYFYAIAQRGLWHAMGDLPMTTIVPVHHMLYGKSKASSSGEIKPPIADELLDHYTSDQLRIHFMNASLAERSVGFSPAAFLGSTEFDPVLNEGNLLTNVFNRLVRSCFYTMQKQGGSTLPVGEIGESVIAAAKEVVLAYEKAMSLLQFDKIFDLLNIYLRNANKDWAARSKSENFDEINQLIIDTFHVIRTALTLLHPITPSSCENIRDYLRSDERIWSWEYIFESLNFFLEVGVAMKFLEPRVDFYSKHPNQL